MLGSVPVKIDMESVLVFDGPPELFAFLLLAERCGKSGAESGAIFSFDRERKIIAAISIFPYQSNTEKPLWLELASQSIIQSEFLSQPRLLPGLSGSSAVVLVPLSQRSNSEEYACYIPGSVKPECLGFILRELEESAPLWRYYFNRRQSANSRDELIRPVLSLLAEINAVEKFKEAAMVFCNEIADKFSCDRAAVGFLEGRYVQLAAINHAEKIGRRMDLPRLLELVMEECLDQDEEVCFPASTGSSSINRAQAELVRRFGSGFVQAMPLRIGETLIGAVVLERAEAEAPSDQDITLLRLALDMVAPRLKQLKDHDKWLGARAVTAIREELSSLAGPKHTLAKIIGLMLTLLIILSFSLRMNYQVDATFTMRADEKMIVAAPFDGFLEQAAAEPGDLVEKGRTLLAQLETAEDRTKLAAREAEARAFLKEAALARRERKTAEAQIAMAKAEQAEAESAMLGERIARSEIVAPGTGMVLSGEWQNRLGGPVKLGDTLYEIAPLKNLEAELYVADADIAYIHVGQRGELAVAGNPSRRFSFTVEKISPAAEMVKQKNVFKVMARLDEPADWLRPGMEGVAKIETVRRSPAYIWTKPAINWLRMKLWL